MRKLLILPFLLGCSGPERKLGDTPCDGPRDCEFDEMCIIDTLEQSHCYPECYTDDDCPMTTECTPVFPYGKVCYYPSPDAGH